MEPVVEKRRVLQRCLRDLRRIWTRSLAAPGSVRMKHNLAPAGDGH